MEGFTYYDIFQTKGIEYLLIIAFLVLLIPFWILINKDNRITHRIKKAFGILTTDILRVYKGVFYSPNHTWAHLRKTGMAEIGLDDFLLHLTGHVKFRYAVEPGDFVLKGYLLGTIEQEGKSLEIYSPISGKVNDLNPLIRQDPGTLEVSPYEEGWICRMEPDNWRGETGKYLMGEEVKQWFKRELERFKDFTASALSRISNERPMIVLQEGGELIDHSLEKMPGEVWNDFQKEFLDI